MFMFYKLNQYFKKVGMPIITAVALLSFLPSAAQGSLIGDDVDGSVKIYGYSNNTFDPGNGSLPITETVVNPGAEFSGIFSVYGIDLISVQADFMAESLTISIKNLYNYSFSNIDFDFLFEDLDWAGPPGRIVGISADVNNDFFADSLFFGDDFIGIGLENQYLKKRKTLTATFYLDVEQDTVPIPEPGTYLLLGSMVGLALFAQRRRVRA